jgi:ABC-type multidrug transport system fused ATPase/permease subunit
MAYHPEYYSVRAIAVILQYTEEFLAHLMNTSLFYMDLENNMIGLERCEQILKIEIEKDTHNIIDLKIDKNWPTKGEIKFVNYRASYRPNTPEILKNINIKIKAREKVGIVGRTGSGKSSLMNALARIIEPKSGHIFIDDTDIQNISLKTIREKISILPQELFLIESTLRDNIDPLKKHSDEEILKICKDLSLFPYLNDDDKLNFEIKENGKNLSTGEKKLICFARTIIRNNKIVILDEPTGALDNEIKEIINENIGNHLKDATVIMITSQVEMLKQCERIIVIDNGEIAEIGEYSELIKNKKSLLYSLFLK